jgi:CheY-like chemotaxis protein
VKILVVDDDRSITSSLSKFFSFKGFQTIVSNDPWEGLDLIQREHFDVVLLDISMPTLSGEQIVKTLATNDVLKDQNIFIFSANVNHEFIKKEFLRRDGINGVLEKPLSLNGILQAITS